MNYHICEDCGLQADSKSFETLAENPAYIADDNELEKAASNKVIVVIVHITCISIVGDKVLAREGDLLLVQRDFKVIYE